MHPVPRWRTGAMADDWRPQDVVAFARSADVSGCRGAADVTSDERTCRLMDDRPRGLRVLRGREVSARTCKYARVCGEYLHAFRTYSPAGRHPLGFAKDLSAYTPEYFEKPYSKY